MNQSKQAHIRTTPATTLTRRMAMAALVVTLAMPAAANSLPGIKVTKDPSCGCCSEWIGHLRTHGFTVDVVDSAETNRVKARLGVPRDLWSCHTAEVGGYVVEGHVPAAAILRLLKEKPAAKGLAVPGMPVGSPGMEVDGQAPVEYEVILFGNSPRVFARFRGDKELPRR